MAGPFVWAGNTGQITTPQQAADARSVAAALANSRSRVAANGWEGLSQVANAFAERGWRDEAAKAEEAGVSSAAQALAGITPQSGFSEISAALSNPWLSQPQSTIAAALLQQNLDRTDPMYGLGLEKAQLELEALRNPQQGFEPTDTMLNLEWRAAQAGLTPGTDEYAQFMLSGGQGGTSLSVDPSTGQVTFNQGGFGSGTFNKTADAGLGAAYVDIQNQGLNAVQGLDTLSAMEQTMADPDFYSGFGANQVMALKQAGAALGINPESVTSMETFNSLSKQSALAAMGGSLGAGFSNADRSFVEQQVASLDSTPAGNKALIGLQRKLLERKIAIADLAQRYKEANGTVDGGFTTLLSQWAEQNPLFPPAAPAPSSPAAAPLPDGVIDWTQIPNG